MGVRVHEDCRGCHRLTSFNMSESDSVGYGFCDSCKRRATSDPIHWLKPQLRELAVTMGRNFFCVECSDEGHFGFLNPDGFLAGEIGDCWLFAWMIKRECPKCHGDPKSMIPKRPDPPMLSLTHLPVNQVSHWNATFNTDGRSSVEVRFDNPHPDLIRLLQNGLTPGVPATQVR